MCIRDRPEAAAIASISLDHTAILGDTYAKIAFEKAGIIKKGGDVVLYPVQDPSVFETIESVSYTHLDVYKRQSQGGKQACFCGRTAFWRSRKRSGCFQRNAEW